MFMLRNKRCCWSVDNDNWLTIRRQSTLYFDFKKIAYADRWLLLIYLLELNSSEKV